MGQALAQAKRLEQAEQIIASIKNSDVQARALSELGQALAESNEYEKLLSLVHSWLLNAKKQENVIHLFSLMVHFISHHPELGIALFDTFAWVDDFLQG